MRYFSKQIDIIYLSKVNTKHQTKTKKKSRNLTVNTVRMSKKKKLIMPYYTQ